MRYFNLTIFILLAPLCFVQAPDTLWTRTYGGIFYDVGNSVQQTSDRGYIVGGTKDWDVCLIKTASDTLGIEECRFTQPVGAALQICPNPFKEIADISFGTVQGAKSSAPKGRESSSSRRDIELKIYSITGRLVKDLSYTMPNALSPTHVKWNGTDQANRALPSGVYFFKIKAANYTETKKPILLR